MKRMASFVLGVALSPHTEPETKLLEYACMKNNRAFYEGRIKPSIPPTTWTESASHFVEGGVTATTAAAGGATPSALRRRQTSKFRSLFNAPAVFR
jgi:hypothetical protein